MATYNSIAENHEELVPTVEGWR